VAGPANGIGVSEVVSHVGKNDKWDAVGKRTENRSGTAVANH
jgi:hypothetical protein